jgi:riboflavin kinase / FMN adenylyltransferase
MKVIHKSRSAEGQLKSPAVAIGNFDGVHLGHQALFARATELARATDGDAVALTFSPHPARFFNPDLAPPLITTEVQKLELMEGRGLDAVVVEPFDWALASLSPEAFVEQILVRHLGARHVVVGGGFVFGRDRTGNLDALRRIGAPHGLEAHGVDLVRAEEIIVSSTKVREFLLMGRVRGARTLLGRDYAVEGLVVAGKGRGRTIGIPTANVDSMNEIIPKRGVYAGRALIEGGETRLAVINIGTNPTFEKADTLSLEAHLLGFTGSLYGERIRILFAKRLRDEKRFSSAAELVAAIRDDIQEARVHFSDPELEQRGSGRSHRS